MARDFYKLEPDKVHLLRRHFTPGRGGARTEFVTRHHLMYIGEVEDVVDRIWSSRPASAHVVIGPKGRWGQAVWDRDTAWANASQWANQRTIAIEHSNNAGRFPGGNDYHDKSWNISDETIKMGARVAAAYCLHEGLGRPVYGRNIRDHFEFTSTGCPVHLQGPRPGNSWGGKAGKYHHAWMEEAVWFYDQLDKKLVKPDGSPIGSSTSTKKGFLMSLSNSEQKRVLEKVDRIHHEMTHRFQTRYPESEFRETLVGYILEMDRKFEDMHANMLPTLYNEIEALRSEVAALTEDKNEG